MIAGHGKSYKLKWKTFVAKCIWLFYHSTRQLSHCIWNTDTCKPGLNDKVFVAVLNMIICLKKPIAMVQIIGIETTPTGMTQNEWFQRQHGHKQGKCFSFCGHITHLNDWSQSKQQTISITSTGGNHSLSNATTLSPKYLLSHFCKEHRKTPN